MGKMFYDKSRKWFEEESIKGKEDKWTLDIAFNLEKKLIKFI